MVTRLGGNRRKTRYKFSKPADKKGKISLRRYLQKYNEGDRVVLQAEPSIQKGMYFRRFHGLAGTVKRKIGDCYEVKIKDGKKEKLVIVHPVHVKRVKV